MKKKVKINNSNNYKKIIKYHKLVFSDNDYCLGSLYLFYNNNSFGCPECNKGTMKKLSTKRSYQCTTCKNRINPLSDTIFENTRIELKIWFIIIILYDRNPLSLNDYEDISQELKIVPTTLYRVINIIKDLKFKERVQLIHTVEFAKKRAWYHEHNQRSHRSLFN